MKKVLTIVTVCYNSEKTIDKCIRSILPQLTEEIEYLLVDGKSTDHTVDIIETYTDYGIRYLSEPDTGLYDAMNKGIRLAEGKWIWFINSDDCIQDGLLQNMLSVLKQNDELDFLYGDMEYVRIIDGTYYAEIKQAPDTLDGIRKEMVIGHPSTICKVKALREIGGFDTEFRIAADWDLILRLYLNHMKSRHIHEVYAKFYCGGASSKMHNHERHMVRKKNQTYRLIDICYIKDIVKGMIWTVASPLKNYILKRRSVRTE